MIQIQISKQNRLYLEQDLEYDLYPLKQYLKSYKGFFIRLCVYQVQQTILRPPLANTPIEDKASCQGWSEGGTSERKAQRPLT